MLRGNLDQLILSLYFIGWTSNSALPLRKQVALGLNVYYMILNQFELNVDEQLILSDNLFGEVG